MNGTSGEFDSSKNESGFLFKSIFIAGVCGTFLAIFIAGALLWHFSRALPRIITVADYRPLGVTRIMSTNGTTSTEIGGVFQRETVSSSLR